MVSPMGFPFKTIIKIWRWYLLKHIDEGFWAIGKEGDSCWEYIKRI